MTTEVKTTIRKINKWWDRLDDFELVKTLARYGEDVIYPIATVDSTDNETIGRALLEEYYGACVDEVKDLIDWDEVVEGNLGWNSDGSFFFDYDEKTLYGFYYSDASYYGGKLYRPYRSEKTFAERLKEFYNDIR